MVKPVLCFALSFEASPWLQKEGVKLKATVKQISFYEHCDYYVLITGIGIINMATAIGWLQTVVHENYHLVNIGLAGATKPLYQWHEIVKVEVEYQARKSYPELITKNLLPKSDLLTVLKPANHNIVNQHADKLIDMEGYAFMNAAKHFLPVTHIHLLKFVSDNGAEHLDDIQHLQEQYMANSYVAIEYVQELNTFINVHHANAIYQQEQLQQLIHHLRLTFTQQIQLRQAWQHASFYKLFDNIQEAIQIAPKQIEHKNDRNEYLQQIITTLYRA